MKYFLRIHPVSMLIGGAADLLAADDEGRAKLLADGVPADFLDRAHPGDFQAVYRGPPEQSFTGPTIYVRMGEGFKLAVVPRESGYSSPPNPPPPSDGDPPPE